MMKWVGVFFLSFLLFVSFGNLSVWGCNPDIQICMNGGGDPSEGLCTVYCDGGNYQYPESPSGNGGPPPDIAGWIQQAQNQNGTTKCGDNCTATCVPVATCDTLVIESGGVVTTWDAVTTGGGGGGDPDPNDSCTPNTWVYNFSCPQTQGNCWNGCEGVACTRVCCPAAIAPAKPALSSPANSTTDIILFPDLNVVPFTNVSQWGLAPTNGANPSCANNYNAMHWYVDTDSTKVNAATGGLGANVLGKCSQVAIPYGSNSLPKWFCTITGGAEYNTTYYWKAQACNGSLCTSSDI